MKKLNLISATVVALGSAVGSSPVTAEESSTPATQLDTIVVTGELLERDLQNTQTSVAVITGEELERRADYDLYDVIERTPGVISAFGEKGFAIRGVDQRGSGGGSGLTVSTTVDGATISNSNQLTFFGPYSTWDLQQVEVLRGPQSTQTGRNALAGAIVIRSKDPVYEDEVKMRFEAGQRDTRALAFAANTPIVDDKLALRISLDTAQTDGYVENPTIGTDAYDAREQTTIRGALRFDPTDWMDGVFKITTSENYGGEDLVEYATWPDQNLNFSNFQAKEGAEIDTYNLLLGFDLHDSWRLESETTYFEAFYTREEDPDNSPQDTGTIYRDANVENIQQEFKALFNYERAAGVIGLFYTDVEDVAPAGGTVPAELFNPMLAPLNTTIDVIIDQEQYTENTALFGEVEFYLTPEWTLIAGARYDMEEVKTTSVNDFSSPNAFVNSLLPDATTETNEADYEAFLPKVGVVYNIDDDSNVGFVAQQGYRAGGTSVNLFTTKRNDYDPEYTWNYEVAYRSSWIDNLLVFNANVFYTDWTDQQINVAGPSGNDLDFNTVNVGESSLYGGEAEFRYYPTAEWDIFASVAYVKTEFDTFVNEDGEDFSGNEFVYAPNWTAALGAIYTFSSGLYIGADGSYTGSYYTDESNTDLLEVDSRFLVNGQIGYKQNQWEVFAYARNMFDEEYYYQAVDDGMGSIEKVRSGEPRTIGFAGTYHF